MEVLAKPVTLVPDPVTGGDSGSDFHGGIVGVGGDSGSDFHGGIARAEVVVKDGRIVE